ncbi:MAG: protein translocase subunit SecD [Patescibacteria group bacterium]
MNRNRLYITFFIILVLFGLAGFLANPYGAKLFGKTFHYKLGLDLQGGTHLVYQSDLSDIASDARGDAMNSVRDVIERRVNAFGVSEPLVQVEGNDRLIIELSGIKDIGEAIKLIGQTPFLEFREENLAYQIPEDPNQVDPKQLFTPTKLTGAQLNRAEVGYGGSTGLSAPQVDLLFNSEGAQLFSEITQRNLGRRLAIFLDGELLSAPTVQSQITEGRASITGNFTLDEAKQLVTRLNSGALPVPIQLLSQQNIGPTLGKISITKSLLAGMIGLIIVALLMLVYYRLPGLLSVIALLVYTAISLSIFKLFNITLTLAGIAGFILSIGMAIDANILIFERTKEELRRGKDVIPAIEDGFNRAWTSIRDSNVSSLITTLVLGYFGSSIIRGFAITLGLGILVSMFSAITVTRTFLRIITLIKFFNHPRLFGIKR